MHVLNVVDGCIPSDMATGHSDELEEERRLLYVAMTRAKEHLHLIVPHRFYVTQQSGAATGMSMPDARASSPKPWPKNSSASRGRRRSRTVQATAPSPLLPCSR